MRRIAGLALIALLTAAPVGAAPRAATVPVAPEYSSSEPADGAKVHEAPEQVTATFSEPLDQSSDMVVEDHCGNRLDDRNVTISVNEMSVGIAKKPAGHYMVTYAAVGLAGATGTNQGTFSFEVHAGKACDGSDGHGGHGGGDDGNNGHDRHGNGPGDYGRDGHSGGRRNHNDHSGGKDHSQMGHSGGGSSHPAAHSDRGTEHGRHQADAADSGGGHGAHGSKDDGARDLTGLAAGETPMPQLTPDSTAVLLALLLCAAFGALGGWLLRVSAQK